MLSHTSHVQTAQDNVNSLTGPYPSYLVLKLGNILPNNNWDMVQNMTLKRS